MFSRATGAPLISGNQVRLLENGCENYPAWLAAIRAARDHVHFENYFIQDDDIGQEFGEAFATKAREGVRVRVVYDWLGGFGKASRGFWRKLRAAGVEVRVQNRPQLSSPLGWLSRDHPKTLVVDGAVGFVSGLCVGQMWVGAPARSMLPRSVAREGGLCAGGRSRRRHPGRHGGQRVVHRCCAVVRDRGLLGHPVLRNSPRLGLPVVGGRSSDAHSNSVVR